MDLHRTLGAERFRQGFRELYLASKVERDGRLSWHVARHRARQRSVSHGRRSRRNRHRSVVRRNTEPYDLSNVDRSEVDPSLPSINGRVEEAYLTAGEDGSSCVQLFHARPSRLVGSQHRVLIHVSGGPYEVPIEIVEYYRTGSLSPRERCVDRGARVHRRNDAASGWAWPRPGSGHPAITRYSCTPAGAGWLRCTTRSPPDRR